MENHDLWRWKATRNFAYVKDAVFAIMKITKSNKTFGEIINVGGTNKISIISLARK